MTIDDFWTYIGKQYESDFLCTNCPVDAYYINDRDVEDCKKGCAFALKQLHDRLERAMVTYR